MLIHIDTNICRLTKLSLAFISVVFIDHYNNSNINSKTINDLLLTTKLYRIYWLNWSGYPSKRLYVKRTDHETHDKIATITGATLGLQSN